MTGVAFHLKRRHSPIDASAEANKQRVVDNEYCVILSRSLHFTTEPLINEPHKCCSHVGTVIDRWKASLKSAKAIG